VTQRNLTLWLWAVVLAVMGILLLLHNYLLLTFDVLQLWPLLLVAFGIQILVRGDLGFSWASKNFGITRGSVESGALRADSGELDLRVRVLQREGRLIAGQYTARSRPELEVTGNHTALTLLRGKTWLLSQANWDLGLAGDLPWDLLLSTYLGNIEVDMRGLIIGQAHVATGFGDIRMVVPDNPGGPIHVRSTFGDIYLAVPDNMEAALTVKGSSLFGIHLLNTRWQQYDDRRYATNGYDKAIDPLDLTVSGTFGDLFLS